MDISLFRKSKRLANVRHKSKRLAPIRDSFMKKAILVLSVFLSINTFAQSKYDKLIESGVSSLKEHKMEIAFEKYHDAWKIDSSRVEAIYGMGIVCLYKCERLQKDCPEALFLLNTAIGINKNYRNGYYNRGICKKLMKDYNGALIDLNYAAIKNPSDTLCYYNRALVETKLNQKASACNDLKKAAKYGCKQASNLFKSQCQ